MFTQAGRTSTNYRNAFITVARDCPATSAEVPPTNAKPTVAALQFALINYRPYELTSDEVLFAVHATRAGIGDAGRDEEWERFFARDQACLRASPLAKRYGWGIHHDENQRVALVGIDTPEYERLSHCADDSRDSLGAGQISALSVSGAPAPWTQYFEPRVSDSSGGTWRQKSAHSTMRVTVRNGKLSAWS